MSSQVDNSRRQLWTILVIVFLGFVGISMPYVIFPALFLNPEYLILPSDWSSASQGLFLGITLAAYPLGQFVGSPILGSLSDDYGRKKLLIASLLVSGICNLFTGIGLEFQSLWVIISSRFFAGLMEGNIAIARAMAADIKNISKHETFGKICAASSMAYLVGPLFGGILADNKIFPGVTIATPFYLVGVLFFGVSLLSMIILEKEELSNAIEKRGILTRFNLFKRLSVLFQNKKLQFLIIVSTIFTLAIDILYEFSPVYLTAKWTLSPIDLIVYNSVVCVGLIIGSGWLVSYLSKRYMPRLVFIISVGVFTLLLIGIVLTDSSWIMLALFALIGLTIGLGSTIITVKISDSASESIQGEVMGVQISMRVLGDAIICLLGGVLIALSPKIVIVIGALFSAAAIAVFARQNISKGAEG
jgi:MFS family permease